MREIDVRYGLEGHGTKLAGLFLFIVLLSAAAGA
jgi:hypothetical protein